MPEQVRHDGRDGGDPERRTHIMTAIDWDRLDEGKYRDEASVVRDLLARQPFSPAERDAVVTQAATLVEGARATTEKQGIVESFLQQFSLGTREGLALMCLAE